jgi:hypothetical protein
MTVLITLTIAGANTGPFNLYSDVDGFVAPFESGVSKSALLAGYISVLVPLGTTTIRVVSFGECTNTTDISVITTTTTTTTSVPVEYDYYLADTYTCDGCTVIESNTPVAFVTGTSVSFTKFYRDGISDTVCYKLTSSSTLALSVILVDFQYNDCALACAII